MGFKDVLHKCELKKKKKKPEKHNNSVFEFLRGREEFLAANHPR